jgi:hypothetical protein
MSGQDSEIDRGYSLFKELLDVYEREPTLANYVRFRRSSGCPAHLVLLRTGRAGRLPLAHLCWYDALLSLG